MLQGICPGSEGLVYKKYQNVSLQFKESETLEPFGFNLEDIIDETYV